MLDALLRWQRHTRRAPMHMVCRASMVVALASSVGCRADDTNIVAAGSPHDFYARLALHAHAVNLALDHPYDTLQLHAAATLGDGAPVPGIVSFVTSDTAIRVDSDGVVTARFVTAEPARVIASLTYNGITRRDSAFISVVATHPATAVDHMTLAPRPGDSAIVAPGQNILAVRKLLISTVYDAAGDTMPALVREFQSSDTSVATIDSTGLVTGWHPGITTIRVSVFAYGAVVRDSVRFTVRQPLYGTVGALQRIPNGQREPVLLYNPATLLVSVGANVAWANNTQLPFDVVFDDPSLASISNLSPFRNPVPDSGNIPAFHRILDGSGTAIGGHGYDARRFLRPGRVTYHSSKYNASGVIIVCDDVTVPCALDENL